MLERGQKGQVTAFIIIAIIIVVGVVVATIYLSPEFFGFSGGSLNFESCVEDVVAEEIIDLGLTAGVEKGLSYQYSGKNFTYLVYTNENYKQGVVLVPLLKRSFEEKLESKVRGQVQSCYENSINDLRSQGFDVEAGEVKFNLILNPGQINVEIEAPTTITQESSRYVKNFDFDFKSDVYEVLMIATSIVQYESIYGDSDTGPFMMFYPEVVVEKLKQSDGTTLYTVTEGEIKFQFASRSLVWPPGYGL